ncbi:glycoside hydrolase family 19 protein [Falsiroseomonas sp.]|uniref:glycoside hydrolase family 19 protein n=1 Tax=Falsiroseomonas sp. TaxID=2870721 RepID=UPI003F72651F
MTHPPAFPLTTDHLWRLGADWPSRWHPLLVQHCGAQSIDTPLRLAAFLANVLHETGGFRRLAEDLFYSEKRLTEVWPSRFPTLASARPYARNPEALGEKTYGGRLGNKKPGDGYRYRGRGLMQTTGRNNYAALSAAIARDVVADPDWLLTPEGAVESATRFWAQAGCNRMADVRDIRGVRRRINGGLIGIKDVEAIYATARTVLVA